MKATITPQDILDLEDAMAALYRAHANADAIRLGALALRFRGEYLATFNCNVDESAGLAEVASLKEQEDKPSGLARTSTASCSLSDAGLAEVVELNGWSRKVPCE